MGYLNGFWVTFKKLWDDRLTRDYAKDKGGKRTKPVRLHGRHVLNRYEDGMEKCIGCELCAGVCPARCIYVRGADNPMDDPVSPGERYGYIYEINYLRCIHCDLCVEACPTEAITESKLFEFSFTNRNDAIYTKAELVVGDDGRPRQMPWEDWSDLADVEDNTSAWMRATAPGGAAEFEGIVAWAGELGFGTRAPEQGQSQLAVEEPESDDSRRGRRNKRKAAAAEAAASGHEVDGHDADGHDADADEHGHAAEDATEPTTAAEAEAQAETEPIEAGDH